MSELILEICSCRSAFSFASPKENADSSEPASPERAPRCSRSLLSSESGSSSSNCKRFAGLQFEARRDFDFPPALLEPRGFSWIFPAIFETAQIFWRCTYKLRRGRCRSQPFATKERYGCRSAACRYTSTRQNAPYFTGIFGEFVTSQWADRVVGPYGKASTAHVSRRGGRLCPPAGYTGFTAIFGEFATSQRADVGIGPYSEKGKHLRIRPEFPKNLCLLLGPTESSAPTG